MKQLILFLYLILACSQRTLGQNRADSLFVFVGEKIKVNKFNPEVPKDQLKFDEAFKATYRVIQPVYGNYTKDTIDFIAYDHMGNPAFSTFNYVLLFVSSYNGKFYHEKYQYFDVYQTKDGRWASCGDPYKFDDYHRKGVKAVRLTFAKPISYDISVLSADVIKTMYPEPYFILRNQKAVCVMGTYVNELFLVKKEGVLKARGIFE